jgi:hypothetical protein
VAIAGCHCGDFEHSEITHTPDGWFGVWGGAGDCRSEYVFTKKKKNRRNGLSPHTDAMWTPIWEGHSRRQCRVLPLAASLHTLGGAQRGSRRLVKPRLGWEPRPPRKGSPGTALVGKLMLTGKAPYLAVRQGTQDTGRVSRAPATLRIGLRAFCALGGCSPASVESFLGTELRASHVLPLEPRPGATALLSHGVYCPGWPQTAVLLPLPP